MRFIDNTPPGDCGNCNPFYGDKGQKGVTIWGPLATPIAVESGTTSDRYYFTMTHPECIDYNWPPDGAGPTVLCNVTFKISTENNETTLADVGPIWMALNADPISNLEIASDNYPNTEPINPYPTNYASPRYHSAISIENGLAHDIIETHDISQATDGGMNILKSFGISDPLRSGVNYLRFSNCSRKKVYIKDLRIIRFYQMQWLPTEMDEGCNRPDVSKPTQPDFTDRYDYPCHYDSNQGNCGGMSAHDGGNYDNSVVSIAAGQTGSWTWRNPLNPSGNYLGPKSCLFNFNNVSLMDSAVAGADAIGSDVRFSVKVNNGNWVDFYHTKVAKHHMAHSVELTDPLFTQNDGYNDTPGALNTLSLRVDSYTREDGGASKGLYFWDGAPDIPGKVNLYRTYRTVGLWDTRTISVTQTTGGTIFTTIDNTVVPAPSTVSVIAYHNQTFTITPTPQSGYVINHVYVDGEDKGAISSYTFSNITANHTITASFIIPPTHTIYAPASEGGSINPYNYVTVSEGSTPSFTIDAYDCYQIASITIDNNTPIQPGGSHYVYTFDPVYANHTITVTFSLSSQDHYPVYLVSGCGSITMAVDGTNRTVSSSVIACVTSNEPHSFYAQTNATCYGVNCHFKEWHIQNSSMQLLGTSTDNPMIYTPTQVTYLTAIYEGPNNVSTYSLSGSVSSGGGIIIPNTAIDVESGSNRNVKVLLKPNSGVQLTGLTRNGTSVIGDVSNNQYTIASINSNTTMVATFITQYTINASTGAGGTISPSGAVTVSAGGNQTFTIAPYSGYAISSVSVNGTPQGSISSYTFSNVQSNQTITASFISTCQSCYTSCQIGCEVSCQVGCQVICQSCYTCQTGCETTCQTGCQVSCQSCNTCQSACELACQTGCQVSCQSCYTCQTGCQVSCQTGCEVSCQTTYQTCPAGYYECQGCETCQIGCEVACQGCYSCQNCQSGCEVSCQGCQTCVSCETLEWCPAGYYECQWCETCQPAYT